MNNNKNAFTLAEVLVTLTIIGIVASLTIPSIVKNNQKQQWMTKYKSTFNTIHQATRMIMADNDNSLLNTWGNTSLSMYNYYSPYLKIAKRCENQSPHGNCFAASYKRLNGFVESSMTEQYSVILTNGVSLAFYSIMGTSANNMASSFDIDLNGAKGPNVHGMDFHNIIIRVHPDAVKPYGYSYNSTSVNNSCSSDLTTSDGFCCGKRILQGDYAEDY